MNLSEEDAAALAGALERQLQYWGDELHDTVCQTLAGSSMLLETLGRALKEKRAVPMERFQKLQASVETAIEQLRRLSRELSPVKLEGTGLMLALNDLSEQISARAASQFICPKPVIIQNSRAALALYRAAQEICRLPPDASAGDKFVLSLDGENEWIRLSFQKSGSPLTESPLAQALVASVGGELHFQPSGQTSSIVLRVPDSVD
jgi:signal transduction histidine kinase